MSRRNSQCGRCNACCPTCDLIFTVETCTLSWNCESCCGTAWEDNQHYMLVALNDDATVYADYGDVGKAGSIIPIFGKTYRLTVMGPDCVTNRVYYREVPEDACPCTFNCYPAGSVATMTVSGFANTPGVFLGPSLSGVYVRTRFDLRGINHTRAYTVEIGDTYGCPNSYVRGERYYICDVTVYSDVRQGLSENTVQATWKVYGNYDYPDPPLPGFAQPSFPSWSSPAYRLTMILQSYTSVATSGFGGPTYYVAPPLRNSAFVPPVYAVGVNGYRVNSRHPLGLFGGTFHQPWCVQGALPGNFESLSGGTFHWSPLL